MILKIQRFQAAELLRPRLISCRAGQHPDVRGRAGFRIQLWQDSHVELSIQMFWIHFPAVPGSSIPHEAWHQPKHSSGSAPPASRCAELSIQLCQRHSQLCQAPHPCAGSMPSSASSCGSSSCAEHPGPAGFHIQLCRIVPGLAYEAKGLELFWMHVEHSHKKRIPGRVRDDPQLVTDRDSLQGKGRESLGRTGNVSSLRYHQAEIFPQGIFF